MSSYIYVSDSNGFSEKMELVSTFELKDYPFNYVIYKDLNSKHFYLAKYKDCINDLDTNISKNEMTLCNALFQEVMSACN